LQELTPAQAAVLDRLLNRGFRLVAFPLYASAVGVRRDSFAALLAPADPDGFRLLGDPCLLIGGNLSVLVRRESGPCFVWKKQSVEATPDLLAQLGRFSRELQDTLVTP
jgi:hypothetical protein